MQPRYFECDRTPLYAVVKEPSGEYIADFAVLMCYPFGDEYMRIHAAFRQLANLLAHKGIVSMRFDYSGTGDSSGESSKFSLTTARQEIKTMVAELEEYTGVSEVRVIGFRLGAALAYESLSSVTAVKQIACWDPIVSGKQYLQEMREKVPPNQESECIVDDTWWINGYPVGNLLRTEIDDINMLEVDCHGFNKILHISSYDDEHVERLRNLCATEHRAFVFESIANQSSHKQTGAEDSLRYSTHTYKTLVDWLAD